MTLSNVVDNPNDPHQVIIWDIRTGEKKRSFKKLPGEDWPVIKLDAVAQYYTILFCLW